MTKHFLSFLLSGFISFASFAQAIDKNKLDQYFSAFEQSNKFMGSVAVSQNGKIVYSRSIGYTDIATKTKPDANTKYRIGSISKTFTSVLVMKAVEEKKLSLDDKLSKYYPEMLHASKISISNLLNHRSGIHNFTNDSNYLNWNTKKKSEKEMLGIIMGGGSDFEPDSKAEYSNSNYVMLAYILQKVYKKPYAKLLTDKIIIPVGLKNTFVGDKINLANNESYSYKLVSDWEKEEETDMSVPIGAGSVVSTPEDLTRFSDALFQGKIIKEGSIAIMKSIKDNFGYGLFQMPFNEKRGYGHTGGIDGFTSVYGYFPDEKVGFALCSNGSSYNNNNISIVLLSAVFNQPYEIPNFETYPVTEEELDAYLGVYESAQIPLKITVSKSGNTLMAQATGQSAFGLDATEKDKFKFEQAGVVLEFSPAENKMILKQGGGVYTFIKE